MLSIGGKGFVQAGAGIVADSVPELEHKESINKAQAVLRAIERAREM
jgi:anthranilate synthase component 1